MEFEFIVNEFKRKISSFLKRIEINHIVCFSNMVDVEKLNKEEIDSYLGSNKFNKIEINSAIFLNEIKAKAEENEQSFENEGLISEIANITTFIDETLGKLCLVGENVYEINEVSRVFMLEIDEAVKKMNYKELIKSKASTNYEGLFFVVINNQMVPYWATYIDIKTWCRHFVDDHFMFRRNLLQELKYSMVNLYSKHLVYPGFDTLPAIAYTCNPTDVCELVLAIFQSKELGNSEKLKALLLAVFNVSSTEYSKGVSYIMNGRANKSKFLKELVANLDSIKVEAK